MVLLSTVDHYNRVAKDTKKRVVGVLLGSKYKGTVDVTNRCCIVEISYVLRVVLFLEGSRGGRRCEQRWRYAVVSGGVSWTKTYEQRWRYVTGSCFWTGHVDVGEGLRRRFEVVRARL